MSPRKKPKISYRDLLGDQATPPGAVPSEAAASESAAAADGSAASAPPPANDARRDAASSPEARAANDAPVPPPVAAPAPVVTARATPIALAAVLNAPRRPTPVASALVSPAAAAAAASAPSTAGTVPPAPRVTLPLSSAALRSAERAAPAPRTTRRLARATVAGRVALESAVRADLAARGRCELLRFRVGPERFALRLADVEEALEAPVLHPLPDLPRHVLGVCAMRGHLVPVHAPTHVLGVGVGSPGVALVLVGEPPFALAADDVEDTFTIEPRALHDAPGVDDPDGVLVGVARHDGRLVGVLDAPALAAASLAPVSPESR